MKKNYQLPGPKNRKDISDLVDTGRDSVNYFLDSRDKKNNFRNKCTWDLKKYVIFVSLYINI